MTTPRTCPRCHSPLPVDSPIGLCPKCLMEEGLAEPSEGATGHSSADRSTTPPGSGAFEPLAVADVAAHFPELEVLELVGRGGMGAVYKARQGKLDRLVALKILPREIGADASFTERFTREAQALARLNHAHIVTVYDFGEVDGLYYILMEYVDGANLRQVIAQQKVTPEEALKIVPQLCDALQYAHELGVVHRDIKPENILLDARGRVKIADFGLSKLIHLEGVDHSLTATHQIMGTLRYMAPEQMLGSKKVDHRADIYSLGIVFYELLTGQVPMGRFDPPSRKVQIDIRLDEVVLRTLEQEPDRRYQQASQVKTDVEAVSNSAAPEPLREPAQHSAAEPSSSYDSASNWSSLSNVELQEQCERVAVELRSPAVGLFLAGLAMLLTSLLLAVWCGLTLTRIEAARAPAQAQQDQPHSEAQAPQELPPSAAVTGFDSQLTTITMQPHAWRLYSENLFFLMVFQIVPLLAAGVIMGAAAHVPHLESRRLALAGGVLAMLPLSICWPFTLLLGGWLLIRLARPRVRRAYAAVASERAEMPVEDSLFARWGIAATLGAALGLGLLIVPWLPWVHIELFGKQFTSLGIDDWPGRFALAIALPTLLIGVALSLSRQSLRWRGLVMLVAAVLIGSLAGYALYEVHQPAYQSLGTGQGDESLRPLAELIQQQMADSIHQKPLAGIYLTLGLAVVALIFSVVDIVRPHGQTAERSLGAQLRGPAIGLIVSGVLGLAIDYLMFSFFMTDMIRPAPSPYLFPCVMLILLTIHILLVAGGICMLMRTARRLAMTGSILALVPTNIAILLSIPIGIWSLVVLCRADVRESYSRHKPSPPSSPPAPARYTAKLGRFAHAWLCLPKPIRTVVQCVLALVVVVCLFSALTFNAKQSRHGPSGSNQKRVDFTLGAVEPWLIIDWSPEGHTFVIQFLTTGMAFVVATALSGWLVVQLSRWDLLQKFDTEGEGAIDKERKSGGVWLMLSGTAAALSWIIVAAIAMLLPNEKNGIEYSAMILSLLIGYCVLCVLIGLGIAKAGYDLHRARNASFVYAMSIIGILPLTIAWPLTMGFGLQTLLLLSLPAMQEQFVAKP